MFKTNYGTFDPETWEEHCQLAFKIVYRKENYQKMPDANGDLGIEGFTLNSGKAFQCYCPENDIKGNDLYVALRSKITKDIKKLETNCNKLSFLIGNIKLKEWYLVTPKNANKNIYAHCRKKERETINKNLSIIDKTFKIIIHEVEDYIQYFKFSNEGIRFETTVDLKEKNDLIENNNVYIENAKRKYAKVFKNDYPNISDLDKTILIATEMSVDRYLKGKKAIDFIRVKYPKDFEKFKRIISQMEEEVTFDSLSIIANKQKFIKQQTKQVENRLKEQLEGFDSILVRDLSNQVVARWLMECSLNFV